jgi:hypothetical protein
LLERSRSERCKVHTPLESTFQELYLTNLKKSSVRAEQPANRASIEEILVMNQQDWKIKNSSPEKQKSWKDSKFWWATTNRYTNSTNSRYTPQMGSYILPTALYQPCVQQFNSA